MIWGDISRYVNGENVLGGVAYKNNKQILHPLLLNTKIYYTQGGNISRGRRPSEIFAIEGVINLVFNSRGCNIRFIMHLHRISGEKKIMMKKGKK